MTFFDIDLLDLCFQILLESETHVNKVMLLFGRENAQQSFRSNHLNSSVMDGHDKTGR